MIDPVRAHQKALSPGVVQFCYEYENNMPGLPATDQCTPVGYHRSYPVKAGLIEVAPELKNRVNMEIT
jgi:hypothetical protein